MYLFILFQINTKIQSQIVCGCRAANNRCPCQVAAAAHPASRVFGSGTAPPPATNTNNTKQTANWNILFTKSADLGAHGWRKKMCKKKERNCSKTKAMLLSISYNRKEKKIVSNPKTHTLRCNVFRAPISGPFLRITQFWISWIPWLGAGEITCWYLLKGS